MDRYSGLKYKVHLTPFEVSKNFPELFRDPVIKKNKLSDKVMRYIIYLYDKGTGLIHEFQSDLKARKEAAATDAGFKKEADWPEEILSVMELRDQKSFEVIMAFLRLQKHNVWTEICVTEQELHEFQTLRMTTIGNKDKGKKKDKTAEEDKDILIAAEKKEKLMKACQERIKSLESLYEQFYGDNKELIAVEFEEMVTPEKAERLFVEKPYEEDKTPQNVLADQERK